MLCGGLSVNDVFMAHMGSSLAVNVRAIVQRLSNAVDDAFIAARVPSWTTVFIMSAQEAGGLAGGRALC